MSNRWENFIDNIKDDANRLAKDELKDIIKSAKKDSDEFIKRQGMKLEIHLCQLAAGQITKAQFERDVRALQELTEMQKLKMAAASQASAQHLIKGIKEFIMDGLLILI
jgi:hypothetical protein